MAKRLLVVGDSISIHYGPYLRGGLDARFTYDRKRGEAEALADLDRPVGANGGDSSMVLDYLKERIGDGSLSYDILLLNCGLHDIKTDPVSGQRQVGLEDYISNLTEIKRLIHREGLDLVWVNTTPVNDEIHNSRTDSIKRYNRDVLRYNESAEGIMGRPMVDLYAFTQKLGDGVYCDHVHYTEEIRRLQAAFIVGSLYSLYPAE